MKFKRFYLFLFLFILNSSIFSSYIGSYDFLVDPKSLPQGAWQLEGLARYSTAVVPLNQDEWDNFKKAQLIDLWGTYRIGLKNGVEFNATLPLRYYWQRYYFDNGEGDPEKNRISFGLYNPILGVKWDIGQKISSPDIGMALFFDLYLFMGSYQLSTRKSDYNLGVALNFKQFLATLGFKINTEKFYWDDDDTKNSIVYNPNWYDISKDDQYKIGTKEVWNEHPTEMDRISYLYLVLGYLAPISNNTAVYGELNIMTSGRNDAKVGINWAPADKRVMYINFYAGMGLGSKASIAGLYGLKLVINGGAFNSSMLDLYSPGYVYTKEPVEVAKAPTVRETKPKQEQNINYVYKIVVNSKYTNIRVAPSKNAPKLADAKEGDMFDYIETVGRWYKISIEGGKVGYIPKGSATKVRYAANIQNQAQQEMAKTVQRQERQVELVKQKTILEQERLAKQKRLEEEKKREELLRQQLEQRRKEEEARRLAELEKKKKEEEEKRRREEEERRRKEEEKRRKENMKLRNMKIKKVKHVRKALEKIQEGYDGPTYALAKAVGNPDLKDEVRNAAYDALVQAGKVAVPAIGEELRKAKIYAIKRQYIMLLGDIGDPSAVPYLERALGDKSVEQDAEKALKKIPGPEAQAALQRYYQRKAMEAKIDSIKKAEEAKWKVKFAKYNLNFENPRKSLIDAAWKIAQLKKKKNRTPAEKAQYKELYEILNYLIKRLDEKLGAGTAKQLLKDNGYDESILTP